MDLLVVDRVDSVKAPSLVESTPLPRARILSGKPGQLKQAVPTRGVDGWEPVSQGLGQTQQTGSDLMRRSSGSADAGEATTG